MTKFDFVHYEDEVYLASALIEPRRVTVVTEVDTYEVWTPYVWVYMEQYGYYTFNKIFLRALASPSAEWSAPLYWPNIFMEGRVCSATEDSLALQGYDGAPEQLPAYAFNLYLTSLFSYFDFPSNEYVPDLLVDPTTYSYWDSDDWYDGHDCGDGEWCGCEVDDHTTLGMYQIDQFFDKLSVCSPQQVRNFVEQVPCELVDPAKAIQGFQKNWKAYKDSVRRLVASRTDRAEQFF